MSAVSRLFIQLLKYLHTPGIAALRQGTKSLRDSPLRQAAFPRAR